MLLPRHELVGVRSGAMTPRRAGIITGVGVLHVLAVWALISGMTGAITKFVPPDLLVTVTPTTDPQTVPPPPKPVLAQPAQPTDAAIPKPEIDIATGEPPPITAGPTNPATPPAADSGPASLTNTHTTPPYPQDARSASHQGTVLLNITVGPQGDVMNAVVAQSSGFAELDQAAVSWVIGHWKYKPATQGGMPMTSTTQAAVKFDLKQAQR
jgi:periplasmic protein TonB